MILRNNGLEVEPGEARIISSVTLLAQDGDTPPSEVIFVFESVPNLGVLQLKVGAELPMMKAVTLSSAYFHS